MFEEVAGYALFEGGGHRVMVVVGHWTRWTCCFAFEGVLVVARLCRGEVGGGCLKRWRGMRCLRVVGIV